MNCMICSNSMADYFEKEFDAFGLGSVQYWRCCNCGFVMSKTHYDMSSDQWGALNREYHNSYQGSTSCDDDPNWTSRLGSQARIIADLASAGVIDSKARWLDYGCGDGKLTEILADKYDYKLYKYDQYNSREDYFTEMELAKYKFSFVITTSVFEHVLDIKTLDYIYSLLEYDGVMGVHTFVDENIINDPKWFYLLPVHCSFYTNKSMQILMDRWGFKYSIYNLNARLWLFFKDKPAQVEMIDDNIVSINKIGNNNYYCKRGFVDYWK